MTDPQTTEGRMERAARNEEQPGTKTMEPVEGKPTDPQDEGGPTRNPERPGTKTLPPVEGADDASGAREPASGR